MKAPLLLVTLLALSAATHAETRRLDPIAQAEDLRQVDASALIQGAEAKDAGTRARVARAYGRIQKAGAIDPLKGLLADPSARVRFEAVFALGQFGWDARFSAGREREIAAALVPLLSDPSGGVRRAAVEAIGKIGLDQTPELLPASLFEDKDAELRAEALLALFRYRFVISLRDPAQPAVPLPDTIVARVLPLARDHSELVRRNLAYIFAKSKDTRPAVTDAMIALASDPALWVRYFAVTALQKSADPRGAAAAVHALGDREYEVRVAAVNALAAMGKLAQVPTDRISADSSWQVRAAYATAVGPAAETVTLQSLDPFRADHSPSVRAAALDSVVLREGSGALADLESAASDASFLVRAEAASDATKIDEPLALKAAADSDVRVRSAALQTLGSYPDAAAFAAIQSALPSQEPAECGAAVGALQGRQEPGIPALAWQAYLSRTGPTWSDVRFNLLAPLISLKTAETTGWLTQAMSDPNSDVATEAYTELKARGAPDIGPVPVRPFSVTPYQTITFRHDPIVVLETSKGRIAIRCFASEAPIHCANFVGRAQDKLYDGKAWHRVVADFVIQGASSDGTGWGNPGYELRAEVNGLRYERGAVGMPRGADFDSGRDEIFITNVPTPHLDGQYTVFGQVVSGMPVIDAIEVGDTIKKAHVFYW